MIGAPVRGLIADPSLKVARQAPFRDSTARSKHNHHCPPVGVCTSPGCYSSTGLYVYSRIIGLAYPLFNGFITLYLKARVPAGSSGVSTTYRNYTIISVMGVPGSIIACLVVDWSRKDASRFALGGRKLTMALTTALTGIFLFLFTTAKGEDAVLGYNCASALTSNAVCPSVWT